MNSSARLLPAAALVSLLVLLLGAAGLFTLHLTHLRAAAALDRQTRLDVARTTALETQIAFKTQVQEWKNILLRGHKQEDYTRHLAAFEKREADVDTGLASVKIQLTALGLADTGIDTLVTTHRTLGADYRAALAAWNHDAPAGLFAVDTRVRGRDRQLGLDIDTLAASVADTSARELHASGESAASLYGTLKKVVLIIGALTVLAALRLVFVASRVSRA